MSKEIPRSEIIFLYDVYKANPNGDPMNENRPRIDEKTGVCLVTDVRIKRTVRDYLASKGIPIFIFPEYDDNGNLKTKEQILEDKYGKKFKEGGLVELSKQVLQDFYDLRVFGATLAIKNSSISLVGPVQFTIAQSLHPVDVVRIQGTTVMPSAEQKGQGTFTEKFIVMYALICAYGVVDNNRAYNAGLKHEDLKLLYEGLWNGTKHLATTSKAQHVPRLLMVVEYEDNYMIGELNHYVKMVYKKVASGEEIRDVEDYLLDVTELFNVLKENISKIKAIKLIVSERLNFKLEDEELDGKGLIKKFESEFKNKLVLLSF